MNGDCGIRVHFPMVSLVLWAAVLPPCDGRAPARTLPGVQDAAVLLAWHCQLWGLCHPSRLSVQLPFAWDPGIKAKCKTDDGSRAAEGGMLRRERVLLWDVTFL